MAALTRLSKPSSQTLCQSLKQFNIPRSTISPHSRSLSSSASPLHFHYEDVLRQDLLLKLNYANVAQVPQLRKIRLIPKAAPSALITKYGKLATEISCGQKLIQVQAATAGGKSSRSNALSAANKHRKGYVSDLARQSTLRGQGMSDFLVRVSTVMSLLDSPVQIRENSVQFSMETEFCQFSPELEDHFEIFEYIGGFKVSVVTSAKTQEETSLLWSGFLQKDEGEAQFQNSSSLMKKGNLEVDEMGGRIDELEQSINDLRADMGQEGSTSSSDQKLKDEPKSADDSA